MSHKHHIRWILLETDRGVAIRFLPPEGEPAATFPLAEEEVLTARIRRLQPARVVGNPRFNRHTGPRKRECSMILLGYTPAQWVLFFFLYSFLGWIWDPASFHP